MTTNNGGPAFPCSHQNMMTGFPTDEMSGMTLRDYFAAKVMQGALHQPTFANEFDFKEKADWAYLQADAMLKARG